MNDDRAFASLPKLPVDVEVEVPEEIEELARDRMEVGHEKYGADGALEAYLNDHFDFEVTYVREDTGEELG